MRRWALAIQDLRRKTACAAHALANANGCLRTAPRRDKRAHVQQSIDGAPHANSRCAHRARRL
eukprot:4259707-Lingulodinium_polyedra.AAC.1